MKYTLEEILHKPYDSKDVVSKLYEVWYRLPACELLGVVGETIQELQYYIDKDNEKP